MPWRKPLSTRWLWPGQNHSIRNKIPRPTSIFDSTNSRSRMLTTSADDPTMDSQQRQSSSSSAGYTFGGLVTGFIFCIHNSFTNGFVAYDTFGKDYRQRMQQALQISNLVYIGFVFLIVLIAAIRLSRILQTIQVWIVLVISRGKVRGVL